MSDRVGVNKTHKLYIDGAFVRSESGRTFAVHEPSGPLIAHLAQASRKDLRNAVRAARAAQPAWAARTGYNRGQILYRVAEVMEGRREQLVAELGALGSENSGAHVDAAIDGAIYWAGFADKLDQLVGGVNPVAGPFLNLSNAVPLGVCGLACTSEPLSGPLALIAPALMAGNTVVAVTDGPSGALNASLAEIFATSDLPGGAVNLLSGSHEVLLPWLAGHADVDLIDLSGAPADAAADLEIAATEALARIARTAGREDLRTAQAFCELRTVWHPARI